MRKILYILLTLPLFAFGQVQDSCYSVADFMSQTETANPAITKNFTAGWNMFGYPCAQPLDLVEALSSIIDKVIIVKNNNGSAYLPEYGYNGIGLLEIGEGYQIKLSDTEYGFSFCESINWPDIEGCTDCEAANYEQWANKDDGSCNYDSYGDEVVDSSEIVGCQDRDACNYDSSSTQVRECLYPEQGYNCHGELNLKIGDYTYGGIVFYIDDTQSRGLVAAVEDLGKYNWGCYNQNVNGADGQIIGTGYQNTLDIVNQGCETEFGGITAAQAALNYQTIGHNDWHLPSVDEMLEMHSTIGQGGPEGNIGGFSNGWYWCSTSYFDGKNAMGVGYENGVSAYDPRDKDRNIRPIRAFGNWALGCIDETACNFNSEANMADGSCEYPELGYDCEGNITEYVVGMEAEGGVVFYVDETGERGLVSALNDLSEGATQDVINTHPTIFYGQLGYEWGCYNQNVNGADGQIIGTGYQNTLDIVNQGCETEFGGITAAQAALNAEINGYIDWFIPSIDELLEMYSTIGYKGSEVNIDGKTIDYINTSSEVTELINGHGDYFEVMYFFYTLDYGNKFHVRKNNIRRARPIRAFGNWTMGCMDETACNFNTEANMADDSCTYPEQGYDCDGYVTAQIGDVMEGGYLFYVDSTGQHGLVAAMEDLDGSYEWGCYGLTVSGADGQAIGIGYQNTLDIVAQNCQTENGGITAAQAALEAEINDYIDWHIPSKDELKEMYNTIGNGGSEGNIGGFVVDGSPYWSSSEKYNPDISAWALDFDFDYGVTGYSVKYRPQRVRVIRAF